MEFLWGKWLGFMEAIAEFLLVADKRFVDWMIFPSFINLLGCFLLRKEVSPLGSNAMASCLCLDARMVFTSRKSALALWLENACLALWFRAPD